MTFMFVAFAVSLLFSYLFFYVTHKETHKKEQRSVQLEQIIIKGNHTGFFFSYLPALLVLPALLILVVSIVAVELQGDILVTILPMALNLGMFLVGYLFLTSILNFKSRRR